MIDKRSIVRLEVVPEAVEEFQRVSQRWGLTHAAVSSRMMTWLHEQPDTIQMAILGQLPEEERQGVAHAVLTAMAGQR